MTTNRTWTLNSQRYPVYVKYLPHRPRVWSVLMYDQRFRRYKVVKIVECTESPQTEFEHLTVKSTLYSLNTYSTGLQFGPFCCTSSCFRETRLSKIWKCTEWQQTEFEHLKVRKVSCIHQILYPWDQNFDPFCSQVFKIQGTRPQDTRPQTALEHSEVTNTL